MKKGILDAVTQSALAQEDQLVSIMAQHEFVWLKVTRYDEKFHRFLKCPMCPKFPAKHAFNVLSLFSWESNVQKQLELCGQPDTVW